jgi:hypothetical protein
MFPIVLRVLQGPKKTRAYANTLMGLLSLRMGLAYYVSHYFKGIAWRKNKYQTYVIPSFVIL